MKKRQSQHEQWLHKFTAPTYMKFLPAKDFQSPTQTQNKTFMQGVKSFFTSIIQPKNNTLNLSSNHKDKQQTKQGGIQVKRDNKLRYAKRLTNEDVLVGNEDQLDAIQICAIIDGFVDTEYLWSLNISKAILHVEVDLKKNYIILLTQGEVMIFQFKPKAIREKPIVITFLKLTQDVRFLQVVKEGLFAMCYPRSLEVYSIEENPGRVRLTAKKMYNFGGRQRLKLFQIPQSSDNMLNIFFEQSQQKQKGFIFSLWNIQVQFLPKEVKMSKATKIYEFPIQLRPSIRLQNYSKEIYFINTGEQIYAIKKGYIIDMAKVDKRTDGSHLRYFSPSSLIHISKDKMEIYKFILTSNIPSKINLSSTDSIQIPSIGNAYNFLEAVQLNGDNYGLFYQPKQGENKRLKGQIKYSFVISHFVKMEDKIKSVLPMQARTQDIQKIEERADMAAKMGLQRKNIYLRLWNNSGKSDVQDYKLLLDTLDYDTIRLQIQKKLKKTSMNYRQVILIEQGCLAMLSKVVFGQACNKEQLRNYMISHMLVRKLQFYRQVAEIEKQGKKEENEEEGKLMINIQNYNHYKTVDIRGMLIQLVGQLCNEDKDTTAKIRAIIKHFRFSLRVIYLDILAEIIKNTKKKFLKVLQTLPQLLPSLQGTEGIWSAVTQQQWQKSLYQDTLVTIQNKQCVQELCESVWFRRYWLTQHQYVNLTKIQIQQLQIKNNSDAPFMHTLEKVFESVKEHASLRAIVDMLQDKYPRLPIHLLGKIFLYHRLHEHFKANLSPSLPQDERVGTFSQFLRWRDPQLFRAMFSYEKLRKGFILKEMKQQFSKYSSAETFREGLLNYFASSLSEISDIKYLLNRMNNQKREFHEQNEGLYEVLVRGMQLKLTLGGPDDVPAGEVLIYIENIPLPQKNPVFKDLQTLRAINREAQRFREMKLNMSIFSITKNMQDVISAVVAHRVREADICQITDYSALKELSYVVIEDIINLKQSLYQGDDHYIVAFIYLAKLCESQAMITMVGMLIEDQWFGKFGMNVNRVENLVIYMYKWKMNNQPSYADSAEYIKKLAKLLPQGNPCRKFIESQLQIALMLSTQISQINYPLSNGQQYFTSSELQNLISRVQSSKLLQINTQQLFQHVCTIQTLCTDRQKAQLTIKRLYEMIVMRMLQCNLLVDAFPRVRELMQMDQKSCGNFIYPCLIIAKIAGQLVEENKNILVECASYLVKRPMELIDLLEKLVRLVSTTTEQKIFLNNAFQQVKGQQNGRNYDSLNPILEPLYISLVSTNEQHENASNILKSTLRHVSKIKQQFNSIHFSLSYIILCNDPYMLPTYLFSIRYELNFRNFRAFLSYLIKQDFFIKKNLIQFCKRMFVILYQTVHNNTNIEQISQHYRQYTLQQTKQFEKVTEFKDKLQKVICESIERMKMKGKVLSNQFDKKWAKGLLQPIEDKKKRIKQRLNNPQIDFTNKQYPFVDSDDNSNKFTPKIKRNITSKQKFMPQFDASFQRMCLMNRQGNSLKPYLSIQIQKQMKIKYLKEKEQRNNIFKNLSIDKQKPASTQLNDAIRNSIRRSRSRSKDTPPIQNHIPSAQNHSSHASANSNYLLVKPMMPSTPPQQKDSQLSINIPKSQSKGNQEKLQLISVQMPEQSKNTEMQLEVLQELPLEGKETDHEDKVQVETRQAIQIKEPQNYQSGLAEQQKQNENETQEIPPNVTTPVHATQPQPLFEQIKPEQFQRKSPQLGDTLAQVTIINLIIADHLPITDQTTLNFDILTQYSHHPSFKAFLQEIINTIYHKTDLSLAQILHFIKLLSHTYPIIKINKSFLEIYERAQKLQAKFNLELPLKSLLGPQGLLLESQQSDALFKYLLPRIVGQLDEQQLIKACKVVTLSFKKSDLEQQIMLHYLIALLGKYEIAYDNPMLAEREKVMLKEKVEVVLAKIPVRLIGKREEEIMGAVAEREVRKEVGRMVVGSCRARYDTKVAEHLEEKYQLKS